MPVSSSFTPRSAVWAKYSCALARNSLSASFRRRPSTPTSCFTFYFSFALQKNKEETAEQAGSGVGVDDVRHEVKRKRDFEHDEVELARSGKRPFGKGNEKTSAVGGEAATIERAASEDTEGDGGKGLLLDRASSTSSCSKSLFRFTSWRTLSTPTPEPACSAVSSFFFCKAKLK